MYIYLYMMYKHFPHFHLSTSNGKKSSKVLFPGHDISSPATDPSSPLYQGKDALLGVFLWRWC